MQRRVSKPGTLSIVAVPDPHLGRERAQALVRTWAILRTLGPVTVLPESTTEKDLIAHLQSHPTDLVLLPWNHYIEWSKVEGHFGIARTSGPTCAGYFASPLESKALGSINDYQRLILLDFVHTAFSERWRIVRALLDEKLRSGVEPLVQAKAPIHALDWLGSDGPGAALDAVLSLPFLAQPQWQERVQPIELVTLALWNLAFEQGRALNRSGWLGRIHAQKTRAHLQITQDQEVLALRLCYKQSPNTPRSVLQDFWPDPSQTENFRQLLIQQADFVRVHPVMEHHEVEIVAGLLKSAPSRKRPHELRSIWIEPIAAKIMSEIPQSLEEELKNSSRIQALITAEGLEPRAAAARILWLERELERKNRKIEELTSGLPSSETPQKESA